MDCTGIDEYKTSNKAGQLERLIVSQMQRDGDAPLQKKHITGQDAAIITTNTLQTRSAIHSLRTQKMTKMYTTDIVMKSMSFCHVQKLSVFLKSTGQN